MSVNSISSSQTSKKTEVVAARKQSEIQDANKVQDRKVAATHQSPTQKAPESSRPAVNASGQKIGGHINTSA